MSRKMLSDVRNTFSRFMLSYIGILIIILLIGYLAYNATISIVKSFAAEEILNSLEKGKDNMEARLKEIEAITLQISRNDEIYNFMYMKKPLTPPEYYSVLNTYQQLPSYNIKNEFVDDFILYFKDTEFIMTSNSIYSSESGMYGTFLSYEGMDYEQWKSFMLDNYHSRDFVPSTIVTTNLHRQREITYVQSLPLGLFKDYKAAIAVLINEEHVLNYFSSYQIDKHGWFYINDSKNNMITSINLNTREMPDTHRAYNTTKGYEEKIIDGKKVIEYHLTSDFTGWTYVSVIPLDVFLQKTSVVKNLFDVTFLFILILGLFASVFLSYRNSLPIRNIVQRIGTSVYKSDVTSKNEYDFIEQTFSSLINTNNYMQNELVRQKLLLREGFYARLLRGEFIKAKELELAQHYIDMSSKAYTVLIMKINGFNDEMSKEIFDEIEKTRVIALNIFALRVIQGVGYNLGTDKVAFILNFDFNKETEYIKRIEHELVDVIEELKTKYNVNVSFGIGNSYTSILEINESCQEAIKASEHRADARDKKIVWYKEVVCSLNGLYYPLDLQFRLVNYAKAGELENAISLLQNVMDKNLYKNYLTENDCRQLMYEMRGTLIKICEQIMAESNETFLEISKRINKLEHSETLDLFFNKVLCIYEDICNYVNSQKKSRNINLKNQIIDFINTNYMLYDLSLNIVSNKFGLSEKYLSNFFKEQTGENFSAFIENARMKQALMLMQEEGISVTDTAKAVGYININTFYKAFKRVYGTSPKSYCSHERSHESRMEFIENFIDNEIK